MSKMLVSVCCVVFAFLLLSAVASQGGNAIDAAYDGNSWLVLDDEGQLWATHLPTMCGALWSVTDTFPGACAIDYRYCGSGPDSYGVIAYPNGDLQPIQYGSPYGDLIPGPGGVSNVEEVRIGWDYDTYSIRSGCEFWDWTGTMWWGPCGPPGTGPSQVAPESWSKIKAEFKD